MNISKSFISDVAKSMEKYGLGAGGGCILEVKENGFTINGKLYEYTPKVETKTDYSTNTEFGEVSVEDITEIWALLPNATIKVVNGSMHEYYKYDYIMGIEGEYSITIQYTDRYNASSIIRIHDYPNE